VPTGGFVAAISGVNTSVAENHTMNFLSNEITENL
jgi:hypothetical protein